MATATKKLTVGMAVAGDFYGPFYSIQALNLYHPEVRDQMEILVVCNTPDTNEGQELKKFVAGVPNARFIPYTEKQGTAAPRQHVFEQAAGELVLCIDSHVFLAPGAIARFILHMDAAGPDCRDMLQGPFLYDALNPSGIETHMAAEMYDEEVMGAVITQPVGLMIDKSRLRNVRPAWRNEMFGIWGHDTRGDDPNGLPFEIQMHGLGLFAMRRDKWPGFSPHFTGFGGEEGYIHEKVRRAGGKTLCAPWLRWWHSFWRVGGIPYRCVKEDKLRNNLIVARELGWDHRPAFDHFTQLESGPVPMSSTEQIWRNVQALPIEVYQPAAKVFAVPQDSTPQLPFVSCLMPTYGRSQLCAEAVACYELQDYPLDRRELVILNTHDVPLAFDPLPDGVRIIRQPHYDRSLGELRTFLMCEAEGELVQHWDDDDRRLPWSISQGVAGLIDKPHVAAWKSSEHWFDHEGHSRSLARNVCEPSITFRADVIRQLGYQTDCPTGQELLGVLTHLQSEGRFVERSMGPWASYVYRWGQGIDHVSVGPTADWKARLKDWRSKQLDPGDATPIDVIAAMERVRDSFGKLAGSVHDFREEWLARALGELGPGSLPVVERPVETALDLHFPRLAVGQLVLCEVSPVKQLVQHAMIKQHYHVRSETGVKIDCPPCRLEGNKIDMLILDADAQTNLTALRELASLFSPRCVIACTTTGDTLARPTLEVTHQVRRTGPLSVFSPRTIPEWLRFRPSGL